MIVRFSGLLGLLLLLLTADSRSQTKIMEYDTGIPWEDHHFLTGGTTLIGKDFLAVAVNRPGFSIPEEQVLFIFDLKEKKLAQTFGTVGRGNYWVIPSGVSNDFILTYWENSFSEETMGFYRFNKKTRDWSSLISESVSTGYGVWSSSRPGPAYFVNTVESGGSTLELHIFSY